MNDQQQALLVIRSVEMGNWKVLMFKILLQEFILMKNVITQSQEIT